MKIFMTKNFKKLGFILSLALFSISGVVYAGTLTPSATPAATSYTLGDIYTRLTTNASTTLADHVFTPGGSPAASLYTLTQLYDAVPTIVANTIKLGTSYLGIAGSLVPNGGTATTAGIFNGLTAHLTGDWDLDTGTLDIACNTATFNGTANLAATAYDGTGAGTNRWCMKETGDAVAGDLLSGILAWVDGVEITGTGIISLGNAIAANVLTGTTFSNAIAANISGTMPDKEGDNASTAQEAAGGVNYLTVPTGFYDGDDRVSATDAQVAALDADITDANILSTATIFGVAGSASAGVSLANMYNGTSGSFTGGSQANGGVDDYNSGGAAASGRYAGTWTACNIGNNYCGTSLTSADAKDENTGLVWSLPCNGLGCASFSDSTAITYSWSNGGANNNSQTASQLCSAGSHGDTGWSLPHQKQLMQAYIDGSYGNLETAGMNRYHWSASTVSANTTEAWFTSLHTGYTHYLAKTTIYYIRCVRLAP